MFNRQTLVRTSLACALLSALSLSQVAHAGGLLGAGGLGTGAAAGFSNNLASRVSGTLGRSNASAATVVTSQAAAQVVTQDRVQAALPMRSPDAVVQQTGQLSAAATGAAAGQADAGMANAQAMGRASAAAAVSGEESLNQQAERLTRKGRGIGNAVANQATGLVSNVQANSRLSGSASASESAQASDGNATAHASASTRTNASTRASLSQ